MKGYIYKITNIVNKKVYIGQTKQSVEQRFIQHKSHARTGNSHHKLARALRKYGDENFIIEIIEECDFSILDDRERYWINFFNSVNEGYNTLLGGQDKSCYYVVENEQEIIDYYLKCHNQVQTFQHFNITEYKFRQILSKNNIKTDYTNYGKHTKERVRIVELNLEFDSSVECARYFIENNLCKTKKEQCARTRISDAITNKHKVYGFTIEKI